MMSMASIAAIFRNDIEPERVAAIILEPVQGEGGFNVAPPELLKRLRALCDQHGIVLIADEVQTGAGRTGTWFAMEQMGVAADLTTVAKSLAGGFPLSAVIGRAEIMDAPAPGGLGGTYAGSPRRLRRGACGAGRVREGKHPAARARRGRAAHGRAQDTGAAPPLDDRAARPGRDGRLRAVQ